MKPSDVPVKTDAGNRELNQRAHKLSPRVRSLLIVIHGTDTVAELSRSFQAFGDVGASLNELAGLGLITVRESTVASAPLQIPAANAPDLMLPAPQAKQFLNETAVATLGLRAFLFTLKLERCSTRADLAALLPDYERAIRKFRGEAETKLLVERANELLS
ncbi:MAG TPA: hypothetical protein VLB69_00855 [Rudaea sp.]|nr:hypothetical protein [Rudaea sp.]